MHFLRQHTKNTSRIKNDVTEEYLKCEKLNILTPEGWVLPECFLASREKALLKAVLPNSLLEYSWDNVDGSGDCCHSWSSSLRTYRQESPQAWTVLYGAKPALQIVHPVLKREPPSLLAHEVAQLYESTLPNCHRIIFQYVARRCGADVNELADAAAKAGLCNSDSISVPCTRTDADARLIDIMRVPKKSYCSQL